MKFLKLKIQSFLALTEAEIDLADRGLVLIQGSNLQDSSATSNGAGKSSIADALCWALYGVTARGESGDQIVNHKAGKGTRVEVVLADGGLTYRIARHRKHKVGANHVHIFVDDGLSGEKDLTKGTDKLSQEVIEKIVGASLEVFAGSIYAGQEKMPDLPAMTDKVLKVLIEEAAGINALEAAYLKARDNAKIAKIDLDGAEREKEMLTAAVAAAQAGLESLVQSEDAWMKGRDADILTTSNRVRDDLIPAAKKLAAEAPQSEIDRLAAEIQAIDTKIASVSQEQAQYQALSAEVAFARMRVAQLEQEQKRLAHAITSARNEVAAAQHKIGCSCDACGRPLTPNEMNAVVLAATQKLDGLLANDLQVVDQLNTAQTVLLSAQETLKQFQTQMTDVSEATAQRAVLEGQRALLIGKDQQRQRLLVEAKAQVERVQLLKAQTSPFVSQIEAKVKEKDDLTKKIQNLSGEIAVKKQRFELENEVVRVFSPAGVRARILDEVTPYLNAQTSKYLSILTDGNINAEWSTLTVNKAGEVKEKFAIDVTSSISSKTFKGLSGGEKRKVRVATALALQDLVSTRAAKPIDLFIGDEIDDALDASGLERLMIILEEKAKERGTVMVISHNSLKDEIKNVLTVERSATGETKIYETAA